MLPRDQSTQMLFVHINYIFLPLENWHTKKKMIYL